MEQILRILPARPQPIVVRYGITVILVGLCLFMLLGLRGEAGVLGFYLLFPAIFLASVLFDRGTGLFATALSTASLYLLMKPAEGIALSEEMVLALVLFVAIALALAMISEALRTAWERALAAERGKDLLLRELGHRTTNNLAMVISVLSLQARSKADPEVRQALEKAIARVHAIASAHEHFQPVEENGRVEMRSYLEKLCTHLADSLTEVRPIAVRVDADDVYLRAEQAVALGLIVNELVTNAFKHAFPGDRSGTVRVVLTGGSPVILIVEDNGIGCPVDKQDRLGSRLIRLLAEQLGAKVCWEAAEPGCRVRVELGHAIGEHKLKANRLASKAAEPNQDVLSRRESAGRDTTVHLDLRPTG